MKWTKERKIAVGVLGLAVAAFLGDRLLLQPSEVESVAVVAPRSVSTAAPVATVTAVPAGSPTAAGLPMAALSRKMADICLAEGLRPGESRDAFTPPASWFPTPPTPAVAPTASQSPSRAAEFKSKYRLTAVMRSGSSSGGGLAVIQGETVRVGQVVGGFRLITVKERSVVLNDGAEDVELELPDVGVASVQ